MHGQRGVDVTKSNKILKNSLNFLERHSELGGKVYSQKTKCLKNVVTLTLAHQPKSTTNSLLL